MWGTSISSSVSVCTNVNDLYDCDVYKRAGLL